MSENNRFRLADVLKQRYEKRGSWEAVSNAISAANKNKQSVDRRKLKRLCEDNDESVTFTVKELRALDQYLRPLNEGLGEKPIFIREESITDSILESDGLRFIVAAKYHEDIGTEAVSRWDMKAVTRLIKSQLGSSLEISVKDIAEVKKFDTSSGHKQYFANEQKIISHITVGSPLANPASDAYLSIMLNVEPFKHLHPDPKRLLPFYFYYPRARKEFPSAFLPNEEEVKKIIGDEEFSRNFTSPETRGIIVGEDVYTDNVLGGNHALLVAQREEPFGSIRLILSGITGPATLGLSKMIANDQITMRVPDLDKKQKHQPILVAVIEVDIVRAEPPSNNEDNRELVGRRIVKEPHILEYINGRWRTK